MLRVEKLYRLIDRIVIVMKGVKNVFKVGKSIGERMKDKMEREILEMFEKGDEVRIMSGDKDGIVEGIIIIVEKIVDDDGILKKDKREFDMIKVLRSKVEGRNESGGKINGKKKLNEMLERLRLLKEKRMNQEGFMVDLVDKEKEDERERLKKEVKIEMGKRIEKKREDEKVLKGKIKIDRKFGEEGKIEVENEFLNMQRNLLRKMEGREKRREGGYLINVINNRIKLKWKKIIRLKMV